MASGTAVAEPIAASDSQPQQWESALEKANHVRVERSRLKKEITEGKRSVIDLILFNVDYEICELLETMQLGELLCSMRGWGRSRTGKFLSDNFLSESSVLGKLTGRQSDTLAKALKERGVT